jgi:hypothetical protein
MSQLGQSRPSHMARKSNNGRCWSESGHPTESLDGSKADAFRSAPVSPCFAANFGDCVSTLRIYGVAHSRAFQALWMAKEVGLDFEHLPIEIGDAGTRSPGFLAINPNGRLRVIV